MKYICVYCFKVDNEIKDFGHVPAEFQDYEEAYKVAVKSLEKTAKYGGYEVDKDNPLICTKDLGGSIMSIEYTIDEIY